MHVDHTYRKAIFHIIRIGIEKDSNFCGGNNACLFRVFLPSHFEFFSGFLPGGGMNEEPNFHRQILGKSMS